MKLSVRRAHNPANLIAGIVLVAVGAFMIWEASSYPFGSATRMGPGYVPTILGALLAALGLGIARSGAEAAPETASVRLRPLVAILGAILAFALLIRSYGLLPSTLASVMVAALADKRPRPLRAFVLAICLAAIGTGVFVWGLQIPLSLIRW